MPSDQSACDKNKAGLGISISLALCCAAGLIVCGAVIARPVLETGSLSFREANCTTITSYYTGQKPRCSCGKYCHSWYPCVRVLVQYVPASLLNTTARLAVMFDTEGGLDEGRSAAEDRQCATRPCSGDHGDAALTRFNASYGPGRAYGCLYSPDDPGFVILTRLFTWNAMFHSMLWTSIGTVIFAALSVYFGLKSKTDTAPEGNSTGIRMSENDKK